jgi:phosphoribosylaminoimidazolecarboxamide formyltransferase/IMP cyclohydrolase
MKKFVLISVFDKTKVVYLATSLVNTGYKIISTAGTGKILKEQNIPYISSSEVTKNPNILKDCIQTISFNIPAGILFNRSNPSHVNQVENCNILQIDIVVCNFPPPHLIIKHSKDFNIQHVDVGGPLMVRSAAINYKQVLVLTDIKDYSKAVNTLKRETIPEDFRKKMAIKAFSYCRAYDLEIVRKLKSF